MAIVKPHKPVAPYTIARWLKEVLQLSGVDVSIFTVQSTRSASAAAADSGVTSNDNLKAADWSTEPIFRKFYYHPTHDPSYGWTVLSLRPKVSRCELVCIYVQYTARLHRGFLSYEQLH